MSLPCAGSRRPGKLSIRLQACSSVSRLQPTSNSRAFQALSNAVPRGSEFSLKQQETFVPGRRSSAELRFQILGIDGGGIFRAEGVPVGLLRIAEVDSNWNPTYTFKLIRWEKAGLHGMRYAPNDRRAFEHKKRRPAMKKSSTVEVLGNEILKEQKLTIGVDLGDRWSFYCVLEEAGKIILERWRPEHIRPG